MEWKKNIIYLFQVVVVTFMSWVAGIAKVTFALIYTNIMLFNIFDLVVYGTLSFLVGYLTRWRESKITVILIIALILPSLLFVGQILARVYITKVANYPSYEWIASAFIIPLSAFIGALLSKRFALKKNFA